MITNLRENILFDQIPPLGLFQKILNLNWTSKVNLKFIYDINETMVCAVYYILPLPLPLPLPSLLSCS